MGHGGALCAFSEDRQSKGHQQVFEDAEVSGYGFAFGLALSGHGRDIELGSMGKTDRFQEAIEGAHVAGEAFRSHLLIEIETRIGVEHIDWIVRSRHEG